MCPVQTRSDDQAQFFREYIKGKKILVCDPSATSRAVLFQTFRTLGCDANAVTLVSTYEQAEQDIARLKPQIVICDYDLGKKCGLDLLQSQRKSQPETKTSLFILATGNTSQSVVARAAEEDIDSFIIKPFTAGSLQTMLLKACYSKMRPPDYIVAIEAGKALLAEGKAEEAIAQFTQAMTLDRQPSLAHFYLGQANLIKKLKSAAEDSYVKGLSFNKIHYKCLVGLYEVLMAEGKIHEAYEVVKRISNYFPANPQRLTQVLKLAIMTQSYDDVEKYYQVFTKIEERNDEIIRYICASLVVCGKHYLAKKFPSRAVDLFKKAALAGTGRSKVLQEIILALLEAGMAKEAHEYVRRFPPELQSSPLFHALSFVVNDKALDNPSITLERGNHLIQQMNVHEPMVYQVMIKRSLEVGHKGAAEAFHDDAVKRWPEQKERFEQALGNQAGKAKK